jgi:hypothetical protein
MRMTIKRNSDLIKSNLVSNRRGTKNLRESKIRNLRELEKSLEEASRTFLKYY